MSMDTQNFTVTLSVAEPPMAVFEAINDVRSWWQGTIEGSATNINDIFHYRMKDLHFSTQKVTELIPGRKVVWEVTDSNLSSFPAKDEWTGTRVVFAIAEQDGKTQVCFTHEGLVPAFACYGDCSWAWGQLVGTSLLSRITTGTGTNVFG